MRKPTPAEIDSLLHTAPMGRKIIEECGSRYKRLRGFFWGNWTAVSTDLDEYQRWMLWRIALWAWSAESEHDRGKLPEWARELEFDKPTQDA